MAIRVVAAEAAAGRAALLVFALCLSARAAFADPCTVFHRRPPTEAEKAFLAADYKKAEDQYRTELAAHPGDTELTAGLVRTLLRQQKVQEAANDVKTALAASPNSPALITLRGEIEFRQGEPWTAVTSANQSVLLDPCNPRTHLLLAHYAAVSSLYATAKGQILTAHQLDPEDAEIREEWIGTLPLTQRIAEIEAFLSAPNGHGPDDQRRLQHSLEYLKKRIAGEHKQCRMVSAVRATEIPLAKLMYDVRTIEGFALDVKLNGQGARLDVDTGAGGLVVSRSVANRAGLKPFSESAIEGVGDQGSKAGYVAYADSIRIGELEFQNCVVQVVDSRDVVGREGLIGMDVFSQFLVTLDYPMYKLALGPLPARPGEVASAPQSLDMYGVDEEDFDLSAMSGQNKTSEAGSASPENPAPSSSVADAHGPHDRYVAPEMKGYTKVYRSGHDLILPAVINKSKFKLFILDTGAWSTSVSPEAASEVTKMYRDRDVVIRGISGKVNEVYTTNNITFRFANVTQKTFGLKAFDMSRLSEDAGMEISGFIGATTLEQLTLHIDYRDGLVKFDYDPNRHSF